MNNIFNNAHFGDKFRTKDGRCAVLVNWGQWREKVYLYVQERDIEFFGEEEYDLDGSVIKGNHSHDIIGKWEE